MEEAVTPRAGSDFTDPKSKWWGPKVVVVPGHEPAISAKEVRRCQREMRPPPEWKFRWWDLKDRLRKRLGISNRSISLEALLAASKPTLAGDVHSAVAHVLYDAAQEGVAHIDRDRVLWLGRPRHRGVQFRDETWALIRAELLQLQGVYRDALGVHIADAVHFWQMEIDCRHDGIWVHPLASWSKELGPDGGPVRSPGRSWGDLLPSQRAALPVSR